MSRRKRTAGLDLGTSRVTAIIGEVDDYGQVQLLGVGEAPAEGLRKGVVVNIDKTVVAIQAATVAAERMAGLRIESARWVVRTWPARTAAAWLRSAATTVSRSARRTWSA